MRYAQVIDHFRSRGKKVCTMWDLKRRERFTVRLSSTSRIEIGEVFSFSNSIPRVRRVKIEKLDSVLTNNLILPIPNGNIENDSKRMRA